MKRDLVLALIAIVVVLGACFALAHVRPDLAPTKSQPFVLDRDAANPMQQPGASKIIMRVNGEPVTERQFQTYIAAAPENMQQMLASPSGRRVLAEQIVQLKALEQEAKKMGLDRDAEISSRLEAERSNVLANAALRKLVTADDQRLRAAYARSKDKFEMIELSHILIGYRGAQPPERNAGAPPQAEAMQKANAIDAALQHGADFAVIARQQSTDTASAQRGGQLGPVTREQLPPEIANVVFSLKPGEISKPVVSQYGIHIFKVGRRQVPTFEQLKPTLEQQLQQDLVTDTVNRVSKSANVYLDPAFFGPEPKGSTVIPATPKRPS